MHPVAQIYEAMEWLLFSLVLLASFPSAHASSHAAPGRERLSLNRGWRFSRFTSNPDSLSYATLKPWILPAANDFLVGSRHQPPASGSPPGANVQYVQPSFDDAAWDAVDLPHDWAIKGPFNAPGISGGMGRLPSDGVGWYRRNLSVSAEDLAGGARTVYLDVDGAMSYAAVWLNGHLVGGWPFGYNSFRLDLTPYLHAGDDNLLAVRLDNARDSSRWYPGAGLYRNVWLVKVDPTHVGQYGTYVTTTDVSSQSARVNLAVQVENTGNASKAVDVVTTVHVLEDPASGRAAAEAVATFANASVTLAAGAKQSVNGSVTVANPRLWGPPPAQKPNLYVAVTTVSVGGVAVDTYETRFGIRAVIFDPDTGVAVNGQAVQIQGTCNHHDQGSLGAAFHVRAAERQLQTLQEMGGNALRTSHNPPAPEFLDLADRLGFLVLDEIFDCWRNGKTTNDYHLLFDDWHEADLRTFVRRDRNHPSVMAWSFGNEVSEQGSAAGGAIAQELRDILRQEDPTRPGTVAMNSASPSSPVPKVLDIIGLNYQGEGLGTSTQGSFGSFHRAFPNKVVWGSETSSALSTRGTYFFPVTSAKSATAGGGSGGGENATALQVSAYELYATGWGSSPDKVFEAHERNPYVAGEFVWTGFDYLGEPTPFDSARSSYFGIVDLAGFKKDRFYLYQAHWRPELAAAHILPHWDWPERVGQTTPVHVFTSGDEAELFVNGVSAGRQTREPYTYRFRWDKVTYQPGNVTVIAYRNGTQWATATRRTTGDAAALNVTVDRATIQGDGYDLAYVTAAVVDAQGDTVPRAADAITFAVQGGGPGVIVATDNGNPADMTAFPSLTRKAFSGLALAIVKADRTAATAGAQVTVTATAAGLKGGQVVIQFA